MTLALIAFVLFVGGFLVERALLRWRRDGYFRAGFLLTPELVPIQRVPLAEFGRTAMVCWERNGGFVRFWVRPGEGSGPSGLHGSVILWRGPGGIHLAVRWSPPWTPLLAAVWLIGVGTARGDAIVALPIGIVLLVGIVWVYRSFALRAAAELRWRWVSEHDRADE